MTHKFSWVKRQMSLSCSHPGINGPPRSRSPLCMIMKICLKYLPNWCLRHSVGRVSWTFPHETSPLYWIWCNWHVLHLLFVVCPSHSCAEIADYWMEVWKPSVHWTTNAPIGGSKRRAAAFSIHQRGPSYQWECDRLWRFCRHLARENRRQGWPRCPQGPSHVWSQ